VSDLTVDIAFEGRYEDVHLNGDNAAVLPTDTMRNTVYALAKQHPVEPVEGFGRALAEHFLETTEECRRVRIRIARHGWDRIAVDGKPHRHSFVRGSAERRMCWVFADREGARYEAGIEELEVLKTTQSAFEGYIRDRYTTLPETKERIFATIVAARWKYSAAPADFEATFAAARTAMLQTFAEHDSRSVQQTLFAMGAAAIDAAPEIAEIRLSLPNRHNLLFDIGRFGLENQNEVFVPTTEPFGLIEATVVRE
jgi:urate oxidase